MSSFYDCVYAFPNENKELSVLKTLTKMRQPRRQLFLRSRAVLA